VKFLSLLCGALIGAAVLLSACSFQNQYEKEADRMTTAVMNNDLAPVKDDIAKGVNITRVQVAEWSDELSEQGKLLSVKEITPCDPGAHCFEVRFEKRVYKEELAMDEHGKVTQWRFKQTDVSP
jgi:hypothetical protein